MKRIINRIKHIFIAIEFFLISSFKKSVLATVIMNVVEKDEIGTQTMYGVQNTRTTVLFNITKFCIIPIAFIAGSIIYLKKSKSSKKKKIIRLLISLILVIAICVGINYLLNK